MKRLAIFFKQFWPTIIVVCVILYATWTAHPIEEDDLPIFPHYDKLIHAIMMGGFAGAVAFDWCRARAGRRVSSARMLRFAMLAVVFSAVDEIVQGLLPIGRPSDFVDFIADIVGVIVSYYTAPLAINALLHRKKR